MLLMLGDEHSRDHARIARSQMVWAYGRVCLGVIEYITQSEHRKVDWLYHSHRAYQVGIISGRTTEMMSEEL